MNTKQISLTKPLLFHCNVKVGKNYEKWDGYINRVHNHGSHYEIQVESRSGFTFIIGKYIAGAFISIPAFNIGCDLSSYRDYFWNNEKLSRLINPIDAATVAEALRALSDKQLI